MLYGRFGVDLVASVPVEVVTLMFQSASSNFKFLGMLKLVRLLRLGRMITFLKANQKLRFSMKLGQLVFFVFLLNHWVACVWYFVTARDQEWFPPKDLDFRQTGAYSESPLERYNLFFYYGVIILVGTEVLPRDDTELVVATVLIFAGTVFVGVVIGEFALLLATITKKERLISEEVDLINGVMLGLRIPEAIQNRVLEFHDKLKDCQSIPKGNIYHLLSPPLELTMKMYQSYTSVSKLEFLNSKDYRQLEYFCKHIELW